MAQVLDYSAGFPGALMIARAGYAGAVRYIGTPGRTKDTTRAELDDFSRNGGSMALVFEETADNWRGGRAAGQRDAQRARDHANAIGFPTGRPIYMAIDRDVVSVADFTTAMDYLRGAQGPLGGRDLTGVYGEADVIDRARSMGVAAWFWQTAAWSGGRHTAAHLYQRIGTVHVGGVACDVNDVLAADWGQHNYVEDGMAFTDKTQEQISDMQLRIASMHSGSFLPWPGVPNAPGGTLAWLDEKLAGARDEIIAAVRAEIAPLTDDETKILAAVRAGGLDPEAFAALVGPHIQAGLTQDQALAAAEEGTRRAFARAGQKGTS